jgi:exopolyphosphatase/guanosine-5'-triphosphate,3'-diphosphate pyrophosphatase
LQLAAILQDVGRFQAKRGHHKRSYRMLGRMAAPLDWSAGNWEMVAALARYHRGALPEASHAGYGKIPAGQRRRFLQLAAVLRLANALDAGHTRTVRSLQLQRTAETITLLASGYVEDPAATTGIAIAKHLLETACGLPVVIRPVAIRPVGVRPVAIRRVGRKKLTILKKRTSETAGLLKRGAVGIRRLALS